MTAPKNKAKKKALEKPDPGIAQRQASDPSSSVWVTASAGTGKTKVLTDRVLRLMLEGNSPDQILCITFTRAASSVMTNRIRDELGTWASCSEKELVSKLTSLTGRKPGQKTVRRARQLFAEFLDSHGGMRIQTIHSFAQSLIRRFPIESGIPPYFDVMDDQTAAEMLRAAQADVLKQAAADPNGTLAKAVSMVTPEVSEDDFVSLITELTYRRGQLFGIFEQHGGIDKTIDAVFDYLKAPRGLDSTTVNDQLNSDQGLDGLAPDIAGLNAAADILSRGTAGDQEKAMMIKAWLLHPERRTELFWDYASVFLTGEGHVRKRLTTKSTAAAQDALEAEAHRLIGGIEKISTMNVARGTESILLMAAAVLKSYEQRKKSLNLLDYDDLIYHANKMMNEENAAAWVLEKLPGNLQHILVDEAQDTNPDQWQLVSSIAREFFTGLSRRFRRDNTIFVVGDEKQSIFSFQRADPKEFSRRRKFFEELVTKAGGKWRRVEMDIAFRSSPAITEAVDAVFANPEASDGLFSKDEAEGRQVRHDPFRKGQAGIVEVHPVIRPEPRTGTAPWALPIQREDAADVSAELAEKIADQIKGWLDSGEQLESRDRPINPADILILVRRRSEFVDHMVRALKKRDVPVAGADRMSLRGQIVVMDMMALGETLLFPQDDYKLACVLKSPLIGMNDQQLEDLAVGRPADLWDALRRAAEAPGSAKVYKEAYDYLLGLQQNLNSERPYEFYSSVLMNVCPANAGSGLHALYSRLGFEAEDPLVEFMNAIERFEKIHVPSLQGFLSWLDAGEAEVKREINLNPETPRVHIMTVHGAKGLEAPIVILPDTTGIPSDNSKARPKFLWPDNDRAVPLWVPRADLENGVFARERAQAELERDREFRRLLYVAMTRAADRLYVYGAQNGSEAPEKSWYALIRKGLEQGLKDRLERVPLKDEFNAAAAAGTESDILRFKVGQDVKAKGDGLDPLRKTKSAGVPVWARTPPKSAGRPVGRFRPSEYKTDNDNYHAPSPLEGKDESYFRQLGTIVHDLFEFLPALPPEEREAAAGKYLSKPAWKLKENEQKQTLKQVMSVLNDPEFGALFGPNSRPEVSITGLIDREGEKQMMNAMIDRLVVGDKTVLIVDYKNSRRVPKAPEQVQLKYIVQMAAYKLAVQQIYPDKEVKCALLWTREAKLMPLPAKLMDKALEKIGLRPHAAEKPPVKKPQGPKA